MTSASLPQWQKVKMVVAHALTVAQAAGLNKIGDVAGFVASELQDSGLLKDSRRKRHSLHKKKED